MWTLGDGARAVTQRKKPTEIPKLIYSYLVDVHHPSTYISALSSYKLIEGFLKTAPFMRLILKLF